MVNEVVIKYYKLSEITIPSIPAGLDNPPYYGYTSMSGDISTELFTRYNPVTNLAPSNGKMYNYFYTTYNPNYVYNDSNTNIINFQFDPTKGVYLYISGAGGLGGEVNPIGGSASAGGGGGAGCAWCFYIPPNNVKMGINEYIEHLYGVTATITNTGSELSCTLSYYSSSNNTSKNLNYPGYTGIPSGTNAYYGIGGNGSAIGSNGYGTYSTPSMPIYTNDGIPIPTLVVNTQTYYQGTLIPQFPDGTANYYNGTMGYVYGSYSGMGSLSQTESGHSGSPSQVMLFYETKYNPSNIINILDKTETKSVIIREYSYLSGFIPLTDNLASTYYYTTNPLTSTAKQGIWDYYYIPNSPGYSKLYNTPIYINFRYDTRRVCNIYIRGAGGYGGPGSNNQSYGSGGGGGAPQSFYFTVPANTVTMSKNTQSNLFGLTVRLSTLGSQENSVISYYNKNGNISYIGTSD